MSEELTVYPIGAAVRLQTDILATVIGIFIEQSGVSYKVSWWDGRKRESTYVYEVEITKAVNQLSQKIGFHGRSEP